eukprot:TRINITY_DN71156_c0_g1_i1.p1 TRINITY_DN71156_c0_g1~~TRINITY_DN71156_c0_g1_i1.p1  ORF type:complete len:272 (-),score=62.19 TRINITY_DN71156_c0_g1_i1:23-838(-)
MNVGAMAAAAGARSYLSAPAAVHAPFRWSSRLVSRPLETACSLRRSSVPLSMWPSPCRAANLASTCHRRTSIFAVAGPLRPQLRWFAAAGGPQLSAEASAALGNIKQTVQRTKQVHLTKAQRKNFQGNIRKYKLDGGKEEFHYMDRNHHGRLFEPWHTFEVVISSSKNNCFVTVKNKGWKYRCVFYSHSGNVGISKGLRKTEAATERVALNIARKLKRLGVSVCEVSFRKIMKVETCLQAFQAAGLQVTRLTHQPRLPKGIGHKPKKQRRV